LIPSLALASFATKIAVRWRKRTKNKPQKPLPLQWFFAKKLAYIAYKGYICIKRSRSL
jgi:hypothetical protein